MQHFLVKYEQKNQEQGYTLLEIVIVLLMISIGATLAVPSLIGKYNQSQVKDAILKLKSTFQTAQVNSKKTSSSCYLNLSASGSQPPVVNSLDNSGDNCTLGTPDFDTDVVIKHDFSNETFVDDSGTTQTYHLKYNYKGNTTDTGTIVMYIPNTALPRCMVVSSGLGMIREGIYDGADPSTSGHVPSSSNCNIIQP